MQLHLGQHIVSADGQDVGTIKHLILDPASLQVKTLVAEKGWFLPDDIEIPLEAAQEKGGEEITLRYSAEEVQNLPRFDESLYMAPPPELADRVLGYPRDGLLWPSANAFPPFTTAVFPLPAPVIGGEMAAPPPPEVQDHLRQVADNNAVISEGDEVFSRDGHKAGEVHDVAFDSDTGRPTELTIRRGWLFHTDWDLPAEFIASVSDGIVTLSLDQDQLQTRREEASYSTERGSSSSPAQPR